MTKFSQNVYLKLYSKHSGGGVRRFEMLFGYGLRTFEIKGRGKRCFSFLTKFEDNVHLKLNLKQSGGEGEVRRQGIWFGCGLRALGIRKNRQFD